VYNEYVTYMLVVLRRRWRQRWKRLRRTATTTTCVSESDSDRDSGTNVDGDSKSDCDVAATAKATTTCSDSICQRPPTSSVDTQIPCPSTPPHDKTHYGRSKNDAVCLHSQKWLNLISMSSKIFLSIDKKTVDQQRASCSQLSNVKTVDQQRASCSQLSNVSIRPRIGFRV